MATVSLWGILLEMRNLEVANAPTSWGFPGGSEVKASACNAGDLGSIPGLGRSPGEGNGNPLQYSCLKNPMDGGTWWATVHGVAKSRTRLKRLSSSSSSASGEEPVQETSETWVRSLGQEDPLEEEMATHSNILAWSLSEREEPGGLQSTGSQRVRHEWND